MDDLRESSWAWFGGWGALGRVAQKMFFFASHGKSKIRDFLRFGVDLGCLLEGKSGEKLNFVHAFFDVVFSCVVGSIFHCFSKAGNLKNVALA